MATVSETLRKAADIIREKGFCQGNYSTSDGRICLANALALAEGQEQLNAYNT